MRQSKFLKYQSLIRGGSILACAILFGIVGAVINGAVVGAIHGIGVGAILGAIVGAITVDYSTEDLPGAIFGGTFAGILIGAAIGAVKRRLERALERMRRRLRRELGDDRQPWQWAVLALAGGIESPTAAPMLDAPATASATTSALLVGGAVTVKKILAAVVVIAVGSWLGVQFMLEGTDSESVSVASKSGRNSTSPVALEGDPEIDATREPPPLTESEELRESRRLGGLRATVTWSDGAPAADVAARFFEPGGMDRRSLR